MKGEVTYKFDLFVDDEWNAGGEASSLEDTKREAAQYKMMYESEGETRLEFYRVERITEDD